MNNPRNKVLTAIGVIMLVCLLTMGFFAFPVGLPVCGIIGLTYGLKCKDRKFTLFSSIALVIGLCWAAYTLLLIMAM